jgi:hypothetical protein
VDHACWANRSNGGAQAYSAAARAAVEEVRAELKDAAPSCVLFLDLCGAMLAAAAQGSEGPEGPEGWKRFLSDGLHLSSAGNRFLFDHLRILIETQLVHSAVHPGPSPGPHRCCVHPSSLPLDFPLFRTVVPNPADAFTQQGLLRLRKESPPTPLSLY